jgi:endonuclease-8
MSRLGPDLLADDTEPGMLVARLRRADQACPLGIALRDQRLVSGIGNMWMSEALWATRLSPWLTVGETSDDELLDVLGWARTAMRNAVLGQRPRRATYRRAGRACPRCGATIRSRGQGLDNRTAYWCPACQRARSEEAPDCPTGDPGRSA